MTTGARIVRVTRWIVQTLSRQPAGCFEYISSRPSWWCMSAGMWRKRRAVVLVLARLYRPLCCGGACRMCGSRALACPTICIIMSFLATGKCTQRCSIVTAGTLKLSDAHSANNGADKWEMAPEERPSVNVIRNVPSTIRATYFRFFQGSEGVV